MLKKIKIKKIGKDVFDMYFLDKHHKFVRPKELKNKQTLVKPYSSKFKHITKKIENYTLLF